LAQSGKLCATVSAIFLGNPWQLPPVQLQMSILGACRIREPNVKLILHRHRVDIFMLTMAASYSHHLPHDTGNSISMRETL
jgi:hypothetical protein